MIQLGTILKVIDNSGARKVCCIKIFSGFKRRYAFIGNVILVSIKKLRNKRKILTKAKKGEIYKALIVRAKKIKIQFSNNNLFFMENSVILLHKRNKFLATRVFGILPKSLRFTKYLKILSLSSARKF